MKTENRKKGGFGERIAATTLEQKGYTILEMNFSNKFGEIDVIAKDHDTYVFVEVKTKTGTLFGLPEEMISKGKIQRVRNMALMYLAGQNVPCRIDVVAIVIDSNNTVERCTHYINVT